MVGWLAAVGVLAALAAFWPWELGVKADPFAPAPAGIRPEWFFLWMFQALKYLPAKVLGIPGETLGILVLGGIGAVFLAVPILDRRLSRAWNVAAILLLIGAAILTVLAVMSPLPTRRPCASCATWPDTKTSGPESTTTAWL